MEWHFKNRIPSRLAFVKGDIAFPLNLRWNVTLPGGIVESPIFAKGAIFISSTSGLYKLDADNGKVLWKIELEQSHKPALAYYKEKIYYATKTNGNLYRIDPDNGNYEWLLKSNSIHDNLCFYEDSAFLKYQKTINGKKVDGIAKFNLDMQEEWFHPSESALSISDCAIKDEYLVYGDGAGNVYGVDINTGRELWNIKISNLIPPFPQTIIKKGGWISVGNPVIAGKTIVVSVDRPIHTVGLDLVSGKILWLYNKYENPRSVTSWGRGLDDKYWYYYTQNQSKQLEYIQVGINTGKEERIVNISEYKKELGISYMRMGLIVGHYHFIGTYNPPQIVAVNTFSGVPEWIFPIRKYPLALGNNSGIYAENKLIWGTVGGDLYCFE